MAAASDRPSNINERTYQEVEYLKKNLGPVLVAALAEICIRRPADPIEYLGHWLLRWRYNEELKRRDVQHALEVVRQQQWEKGGQLDDTCIQGATPTNPNLPPGYGGPLEGPISQLLAGENEDEAGEDETVMDPPQIPLDEGAEETAAEDAMEAEDPTADNMYRSFGEEPSAEAQKLTDEADALLAAPASSIRFSDDSGTPPQTNEARKSEGGGGASGILRKSEGGASRMSTESQRRMSTASKRLSGASVAEEGKSDA